MPVLRLQFPRRAGRNPRTRLSGCVAQRPGTGAAVYLGPPGRVRLHRWRHAQPAVVGRAGRIAGHAARLSECMAGCRDHHGGEPRHRRGQPLSRLRGQWRHALLAGHPEFRQCPIEEAGAHP
ncbi:hypothetical protein G6F61_014323 [Rhizopus arrhizus]|nr:hypothetical protein G6F61_014323 [Rhizopus arrhizus]